MSKSALDDIISLALENREAGDALSAWHLINEHSSMQAELDRLQLELGVAADTVSCYGRFDALRDVEASIKRTREALGIDCYAANSVVIDAAFQPYRTEVFLAETAASAISAACSSFTNVAEQGVAALAAATANSLAVGGIVGNLKATTQEDLAQAAAAGLFTPLQASIFSSAGINAAVGALPDLLGTSAYSGVAALQAALGTSRYAYPDDLRESFHDYAAQEAERLKQLTEAFTPTPVRTLGELRTSSSSRHVAQEIERLIARHGAHFMPGEALALEAVTRTAEQILSTRSRHLIGKKFAYIAYNASFGSRILSEYVWLLLRLWSFLGKSYDGLFDTPQAQEVRQTIGNLLPPPDHPLARHPKVKPNAPNITA